MKRILLVGKMNGVVKDLNAFLVERFYVQICSENTSVVVGMLDIANPDIVIISLVGALDIEPILFNKLKTDHPDLPVLTIGTESERNKFLKFYEGDQFENLIRPIENSDVLAAIVKRLGLVEGEYERITNEAPSGKKRILVVDDNAATLRSIKGMLDTDYEVVMANSGIKAMTAIGKKRPDLILLDYEMPVCDGKQTLEMIRADGDLQDIPVIFLTGVSDRAHIEAVLDLKPSGYLLKPPIREKIIEAIEKAIRES
ncbi:MAG: response regulator [Lachnospiraceae bacterium]|nr:response regulator [Lachnospiraceae bacterium]